MRKMKRFAAILAAAIMTMAMAVPAMAADIEVSNPASGETYSVYKVFDVTSNDTGTAYSYTISTGSKFYDTVSAFATEANGMTLTASASDKTVMNVTIDTTKFTAEKAAALASALSADESKPDAVATLTKDNSYKATDLAKGYYFVDTTTGSLCSLVTEDSTDVLYEKNSIPTITKAVKDDNSGEYGEWADVDLKDKIDYKLTVNTGTNENFADATGNDADFKIVDEIPAGITVDDTTIAVKVGDTAWTKDTDYTESIADDGKLTIVLKTDKIATLDQDTDIVITYSGTANDSFQLNAVANTNKVTLTYKNQTSSDTADVITYELNADKKVAFTKTDADGNALEGVQFSLYNTELKKYVSVGTDMTGKLEKYVDSATVNGEGAIVTDKNGKINVVGLDQGTYTLTEIQALDGYNIATNTWTITISEATKADDGTYSYTVSMTNNATNDTENTIVNQKGTLLPSTGGMGTTIFYIVGGCIVAAAVIILVIKRRRA